jgi:hypothetical protein
VQQFLQPVERHAESMLDRLHSHGNT